MNNDLSRRGFVAGAAALAPVLGATASFAADAKAILGTPASVVSNPPRVYGPDAPPSLIPDPDVIVVDPSFQRVRLGQGTIKRLGTGFQWAEGPAWCSEGRYAIFSDVKGNVQYRYIWETGEITPFRRPSYNSNGNTYDFQGRQVSCQHYLRRMVRWEVDGSLTIIADTFDGKGLNSPDDVVVHRDGSIWFTDPRFGGSLSEGHADTPGTGSNADGRDNPELGGGDGLGLESLAIRLGDLKQELPANTYRWDPNTKKLKVMFDPDKWGGPNGLAFSPDYKKVYSMGKGNIYVSDLDGANVSNTRVLTDCVVDGIPCRPDGMRTDHLGNVWAGSNAPLGYAGVTVWNPDGKLIGRIRLPEVCANVCFAGPKRDYLFMAATQSIYMLRVNVQGVSAG